VKHSTIYVAVVAAALAGLSGLAAQEVAQRRLGTCGPPPRQNPERQTAAEGIPPLPLPATPLRRSEPKAEPTAPIMIAKLEYGDTQDWNTDPGDVDNLMRHCRYELGVWYGWKHWNVEELAALHQAGEQSKIPILYISGHEAFEFTPPQRDALRQYLLDGGTLLADACCGRQDFASSFQREVSLLFPDRAFDLLEVDHPIYRAYYPYTNVHYRTYDGGVMNEFQGPPQLLGMNVGCRTAIVFTPWDMSCGWDEHTHEHGSRLLPGDAIRLGINIISYVAGERQLGEAQSVTRELAAPAERPRQQFAVGQLRHQGDWNPDPNGTYQMLRHLALDSSLEVGFDLRHVDADEAQLAPLPFLYLTGHRDPEFSENEIAALRSHLQAGGFLFVNNCCGRAAFDAHVRALAGALFPDQPLAALPPEHPLFDSFYTLAAGRDRQSGAERPLELEGLTVRGRTVLVYSKNDAVGQLKQVSDPYGNGYDAETCRRLVLNVVAYALQN